MRFGVYEFDPSTGDLWKSGHRVRLQEQPRQVLGQLVARPGELVTREELRAVLWPGDTFVDFETGLNVIVNKLRQALDDSASSPRFIETLPRRGYRFVAPVAPADSGAIPVDASPVVGDVAATVPRPTVGVGRSRQRAGSFAKLRFAVLLAAVGLVAATAFWGSGRSEDAARASSAPRVQRLAVLPLQNLSGVAGEQYFADGLTEALITELWSLQGVEVISHPSTMRYRDSTAPIATIAAELGVDAIVRGSVLRTADRARLNVQLVDATTGVVRWADAYEHDLRDVLELQRDVARAVAGEIRVALTPGARARLNRASPVNPDAYLAYQLGRYLLAGVSESPAATDRALVEFERAASLDSSYAPAWVGIAEVHQIKGTHLGGRPPIETRPLAYRAARHALDLDPDLGEAHAVLARVQLSEFDWEGADRSFERMLDLSPGDASGLVWYSYSLLLKGRFDDALEVALRAEALDPLNLNTRVRVGFVHGFARRLNEAVTRYEDVLTLDADNLMAREFLSSTYIRLGRFDDAVAAATAAVERHGRWSLPLARLAAAQGQAGHRAEAQALLDELLAMSDRQYVPPAHLAITYAGLGDRDRALEWFEHAYEERSNFMMYFPIEQSYNWTDDPRYTRLVAKIRQQHTVRERAAPAARN